MVVFISSFVLFLLFCGVVVVYRKWNSGYLCLWKTDAEKHS